MMITNSFEITRRICSNDPGISEVDNCELYSSGIAKTDFASPAFEVVCIECEDGFVPLIQTDTPGTDKFVPFDISTGSDEILNIKDFFVNIKSCGTPSSNNVLGMANNSQLIDNCKYYVELEGLYGCAQCIFQYSGIIGKVPDTSNYYFMNCDPISNCTDTKLGGLNIGSLSDNKDLFVTNYVNCHVCEDDYTPLSMWQYDAGFTSTIVGLG